MELKLLITLFRRWAWLLILGLALGAGGGYLASQYTEPVYQATTRVMILKPQESSVTADVTLSDQELTQTYITLLTTRPVLEATSEEVGFPVSGNQISARQLAGTRVLEVTARARFPERAALVANTLVGVLVEQNDRLQASRFASSEESLQAQIDQVEAQIAALQADLDRRSTTASATRSEEQAALETEIGVLQRDIARLQQEVDDLLAPDLSAAQQETLSQTRLDLAEAQFNLSVERQAYDSRIADNPSFRSEETEDRILELQRQTFTLQDEIDDLTAVSQAEDPARREELIETRAQLAQTQMELDLALQRYSALTLGRSAAADTGATTANNQERSSLSLYQQLYGNLLTAYESVRLARLQNTPGVAQVEAAVVPTRPIQPRPLQNTLLGAAVGLIIMAAIAFLIEYLDDTLKTPVDISALFGVPVIGFIARTAERRAEDEEAGVVVAAEPRSPVAEAFRALRTNLEFAAVEKPLRTILITSPQPRDGKSTVAANLAAIIAQGGSRVLLLDADLRRPVVHRHFNLPNRQGITDIFRNQATLADLSRPIPGMENLSVLTTGSLPPNPAELLSSARMQEILHEAQAHFDTVIVDSPPFVVSDAALLSSKVDGVVLVLQPGETNVDTAQAMFEQLRRADARVVGVVLNRIPHKRGIAYGGYRYYYAPYYYSGHYNQQNGHGPQEQQGRAQRIIGHLRQRTN